jgi:hypothetical protein
MRKFIKRVIAKDCGDEAILQSGTETATVAGA